MATNIVLADIQNAIAAAKTLALTTASPSLNTFTASVIKDPTPANFSLQLLVLQAQLTAEIPAVAAQAVSTFQSEVNAQVQAYIASLTKPAA